MAWLSQVAFPFDAYNYTTFGKHCKKKVQLNLHRKSLTGGAPPKSSKKARQEVAGVEGSLEFIVDHLDTRWCESDDIKRILSDAIKTLENARDISRDAESNDRLSSFNA